jgi:predicted O-methyltransferase YrrM
LLQEAEQLVPMYNQGEGRPGLFFSSTKGMFVEDAAVSRVWVESAQPEIVEQTLILQVEDEIKPMLNELYQRGLHGTVLEIGFARGGFHMLLRRMFSRVISIDGDPRAYLRFLSHFNVDDRSTFICGDSRAESTLNIVKSLGDSVDLVFIDGGHTYQNCRSDYLVYSRFAKPGGIIAIHDACHPYWTGPRKFITELENGDVDGVKHGFVSTDCGKDTGLAYEVVPDPKPQGFGQAGVAYKKEAEGGKMRNAALKVVFGAGWLVSRPLSKRLRISLGRAFDTFKETRDELS